MAIKLLISFSFKKFRQWKENSQFVEGRKTNFMVPVLENCFRWNENHGRKIWFQSGGTMEHWKVFLVTMVGRQEKFLNCRLSRKAKAVTF